MIKVVCGIIFNQDKIFIARRNENKSMPGKWEFPGGKIEKNENATDALRRELKEEFGMEIHVGEKIGSNQHQYPDFKIELIAYKCDFITATFKLTDHDAYQWVDPKDLIHFDLAEADIPFIKLLT